MSIRRPHLFALIGLAWVFFSWFGANWYAENKIKTELDRSAEVLEAETQALFQTLGERLNLLGTLPGLLASNDEIVRLTKRYSGESLKRTAGRDIQRFLTTQPDLAALNLRLREQANHVKTNIIFIVNDQGYCIASSNAGMPGSIVGAKLDDRSYFQDALNGNAGHQYAMGRNTNIPGLFYSAPISGEKKPIGVYVIKSDITNLQKLLMPYHAFLTDNHDVIVLSSQSQHLQHVLQNARFNEMSEVNRQSQYKRTEFPILSLTAWPTAKGLPLFKLGTLDYPVMMNNRMIPGGDLGMYVFQDFKNFTVIQNERYAFWAANSLAGFFILGLLFKLTKFLSKIRDSEVAARRASYELENLLESREDQLDSIVEHLPLMVVARDENTGLILTANQATQRILKLENPIQPGQTYESTVDEALLDFLKGADYASKNLAADTAYREMGLHIADQDQILRAQTIFVASKVKGQGGLLIDLVEDVTEARNQEQAIRRMAYTDSLTNLPNRRALFEQLTNSIKASQASQRYGALFLINLDGLKLINERIGHEDGDKILIELARRLSELTSQNAFSGKLAGDEFAVILETEISDMDAAAEAINLYGLNLIRQIVVPYVIGHHTVNITASVGVTLFGPGRPSSSDELLKETDAAMYEAKRRHRGGIHFFDEGVRHGMQFRAILGNRLLSALRDNNFEQYYQPQVDIYGRVVGVEALIRWTDEELGIVSPSTFIPLAEALHIIVDIDRWVLQEACKTAKSWRDQPELSDKHISINVSAEFFTMQGFVDEITHAMTFHGLRPSQLMIELTEWTLIEENKANLKVIKQLESLGIKVAIDDFGTGNSSLAYIRRFSVGQLKIDQSFIRDMLTDQRSFAITEFIIRLSQSLGYHTLAEGVETEEQFEKLRDIGCQFFQGYLFGKPLNLNDCVAFIRSKMSSVES